jgi:hypothetical protein
MCLGHVQYFYSIFEKPRKFSVTVHFFADTVQIRFVYYISPCTVPVTVIIFASLSHFLFRSLFISALFPNSLSPLFLSLPFSVSELKNLADMKTIVRFHWKLPIQYRCM